MIERFFFKKNPLPFEFNPIVKAFIVSEMFFWSAWSTILPLLSVFAVEQIPGSSIGVAAFGYSVHVVCRILGSLTGGIFFSNSTENRRIAVVIFGIYIVSVAYIGFASLRVLEMVYVFYGLAGLGVGLASPIRTSFFSKHLDRNEETLEWSALETIVLSGVAVCSVISGLVLTYYGFTILFLAAAIFNMFSTLPYVLFLKYPEKFIPKKPSIFPLNKEQV